jgi:hypothetical protein
MLNHLTQTPSLLFVQVWQHLRCQQEETILLETGARVVDGPDDQVDVPQARISPHCP